MGADEDHPTRKVGEGGVVVARVRVQPPEQDRKRDVDRARDHPRGTTVVAAAGVHEERAIGHRPAGGLRRQSVDPVPRGRQHAVDRLAPAQGSSPCRITIEAS